MRSKLAAVAAMLAATMAITGPAAAKGPGTELDFLGQAIVATGTTFDGTTVGGLSSITYDARRDLFYAISDDPGQFQPTRFYTVALDLRDGGLQDGDVRFVDVTTLLAPDGSAYAPFSLDPEGLALTKDRELIFTSEGIATRVVDPFVRRYRLDGSFAGSLFVPQDFLPNAEGRRGVRQNLGFESAGVPPNGRFAFVATENALVQDGPPATLAGGSRARIVRYHLPTGRLDRQWVYETDPVAEPPVPSTQFSVNGLVELLPLNNSHLIAMERSFSVGAPGTGNTIKLYDVALTGTSGEARKTLLLDLEELGVALDNIEGMTLGPRLPDGRRSVVLVSDNNFAANQFTQFMLFALKR